MSRNRGRQEAQNRYDTRQQQYSGLENDILTRLPAQRQRDQEQFDIIWQGFLDVLNDPRAMTGFEELSRTGGWDPARRASMDQNIRGLKEFGRTGGLDAESIDRFRGKGYYDELIKTGGWGEGDIANVRARTASQTPSFYATLRDSLDQARSAQGGYSPGYTHQTAKMARDAARGGVEAVRDTEIGLGESIRSGRLAGATGMTNAENSLQSLRTRNMLSGLTGASDVESNMINSITQGRLAGLGGMNNVNQTRLGALGGMNTARGTPGQAEREFTNLLRIMGMSDTQAAQMIDEMSRGGFNWMGLLGFLPLLFGKNDDNTAGSNFSRLMSQIRNAGRTSPEPSHENIPFQPID